MSKLTAKQQRFVEEYLIDLNATQAALRAGYSEKTAYSIGQGNLKKVEIATAIQAAMDKRSEKTGITAEQILRELEILGTSNAQDFFTEDGCLRSIAALPREVAACIQSFDVVTRKTGDKDEDGNMEVEQVYRVKFYDKMKGLELLGKHKVLFSDKIVHELPEAPETTEEIMAEVNKLRREMEQLDTLH